MGVTICASNFTLLRLAVYIEYSSNEFLPSPAAGGLGAGSSASPHSFQTAKEPEKYRLELYFTKKILFVKNNFYNYGQSLIGIIIVLVVVGLVSGGVYYYFSKQIPKIPGIPEKSTEGKETKSSEEEVIPQREESVKEIPSTIEKNKNTTGGQLSCIEETTKAGVTCGGTFYEDYCGNLANGTGYANTRKCNAPVGSSCSSLVIADRTFCSYGCQNGTCIAVPTQKEESASPQPMPSKVKTTGNLNWEIVFTHTGERLPDTIKNDLCIGNSTNKLSYLPTWFKREANKYGVSLSISLNCYSQQIELPQNVLTNPDHYTAFGQSIPLPLNMAKTRDYILQTVSSSQNYDLITVVNYVTSGGRIADVSSIGGKVSFVFIVKSNFIDGVQYYAPNVTEPNIEASPAFVKSIAHEALHNLGAYDHYDYSNPGDCQTETDQSLRYISPRIMCTANLLSFADYIIPSETAKEIGWIK